MSSDPLAIPVKKGEKYFFFFFEIHAALEGEQSKAVKNSVYLVYFVYVLDNCCYYGFDTLWLWLMFGLNS